MSALDSIRERYPDIRRYIEETGAKNAEELVETKKNQGIEIDFVDALLAFSLLEKTAKKSCTTGS